MNDRLVLSSAFFNITGGRRQDSADTFRVLASLHTNSGEEAALFAVSEASAPGPMGARARRLVIDVIQGEYTSRFDQAAPTKLRLAVEAAHRELQSEFKGHVRVGLTALLAEGTSLYLLQVPPAQAYVLHEGNLHSVNTGPLGSVPFAHSLGCNGEPETSLFRDRVEESDIIVLCSSWFSQELDGEELRSAFAAENPDQISESLFSQARARHAREVTCVALQAVPDAEPFREAPVRERAVARSGQKQDAVGGGVLGYVDESIGSLAYVWQRAVAELKPPKARPGASRLRRPSVKERQPAGFDLDVGDVPEIAASTSVEPAVLDEPEAGDPYDYPPPVSPADPDLGDTQYQPGPVEHGTEELPIVGDIQEAGHLDFGSRRDEGYATSDIDSERYDSRIPPTAEERDEASQRDRAQGEAWTAGEVGGENGQERARTRENELDEVNSFIQNTPNLGKVAPPVQGFPDTTVAPERIYPRDGESASGRTRRFSDVVRPRRKDEQAKEKTPLLQPRMGSVDTRARRNFSLAAVPPAMWLWSGIGVAVVVLFAIIYFAVSSGGPAAINYPQKARMRATKALHSSNSSYQNRQLRLAYKDIQRARKHNFAPKQVSAAQRFVVAADHRVHRITAVSPTVVVDFSSLPQAHPAQLNGGSGTLYILDNRRKIIYSTKQTAPTSPTEIAKPGEFFSTIQWHDPILMTADGTTMLALDQQYHLAFYNGQLPVTAVALSPISGNGRAMTVYAGNVYILDNRSGQIWRYYGAENSSTYSPTGYLTNAAPRELHRSVSLAIDGNVYVGLAGGRVIKYSGQKQVPFQVHSPQPLRHLGEVYTRQDLNSLFITDPRSNQILQIGKKGGYIQTIQLPRGEGQLRQITVSSDAKTLFFIGGKRIYRLTIPR